MASRQRGFSFTPTISTILETIVTIARARFRRQALHVHFQCPFALRRLAALSLLRKLDL